MSDRHIRPVDHTDLGLRDRRSWVPGIVGAVVLIAAAWGLAIVAAAQGIETGTP